MLTLVTVTCSCVSSRQTSSVSPRIEMKRQQHYNSKLEVNTQAHYEAIHINITTQDEVMHTLGLQTASITYDMSVSTCTVTSFALQLIPRNILAFPATIQHWHRASAFETRPEVALETQQVAARCWVSTPRCNAQYAASAVSGLDAKGHASSTGC